MAKRQQLVNPMDESPYRKTTGPQPEPGDNADLDEGRIVSAGVGITEGELAALDTLAERCEVSRNSLMRLATRLFIEAVRAGTINPEDHLTRPQRPRKRLKIGKQSR